MAKKKNPQEKLTLDEYLALKKKREKQRITFYPWPVMLAICLPFAVLIMLIILYSVQIKNAAG